MEIKYFIAMKRTALMLLSAALVMCLAAGCRNGKAVQAAEPEEETAPVENCFTAIDKYLTEEIGQNYAPGEYTIPTYSYTAVDDINPDDILVWGDFWVYNYNKTDDTLETVSGGNHPGKMHLKKDAEGHYTVTAFEQVEDGSGNLSSAQRIFGERYDEFQQAQANDEAREHARARAIAEYAQSKGLDVKYYKDFGWPAVELPAAE